MRASFIGSGVSPLSGSSLSSIMYFKILIVGVSFLGSGFSIGSMYRNFGRARKRSTISSENFGGILNNTPLIKIPNNIILLEKTLRPHLINSYSTTLEEVLAENLKKYFEFNAKKLLKIKLRAILAASKAIRL